MLPSVVGPISCDQEQMSWDLHEIVKAWVKSKYRWVERLVFPILEWMIWRSANGRNEETSASEIDIRVVTLPYQKLKAW